LKGSNVDRREGDFIKQALGRVEAYFGSERGRGPLAVSRFYGTDESRRVDAYQRVRAFLGSVHLN